MRASVPNLLDIISHPQEGIGALVDLGEVSTQALGAGSMSGGGNVQSVQGIMDLFGHEDESSSGSGVGQLALMEQLSMLWQSSLYIWLTLALCSLYYVVTGTQFWITEYANAKPPEGLGVDPTVVLWSFAFTSVTAPVIGVFLGGWIIDQQGGYKDEVYSTLRTCLYFAIGAVVSAVPATRSTNFNVVMVALWFILFFGGCIISPATGVCINAVHADLRSFSSAMSMFACVTFPPLCCHTKTSSSFSYRSSSLGSPAVQLQTTWPHIRARAVDTGTICSVMGRHQ